MSRHIKELRFYAEYDSLSDAIKLGKMVNRINEKQKLSIFFLKLKVVTSYSRYVYRSLIKIH